MRMFRAGLALIVLALGACAYPQARESPESGAPEVVALPKGEAGGVFTPAAPWALLSDNRAFRPGDALTVVLQETTQASKSADTSYDKQNNVALAAPVIGGNTVKADVAISAQRDFSGKSSSSQQNALQ